MKSEKSIEMSFFHHCSLYPFIDCVLTSREKHKDLDAVLQEKSLFYTDPPSQVYSKLSTATVLYVYPDSFNEWTDILLVLQEKRPLPVKLMIFADSDLSLENDHMEALFAFFPETEFWIQNWMGDHSRATLLPIGISNHILSFTTEKKSLLGISYLNSYIGCKPRDEFFSFLHTSKEMLPYCLPKVTFNQYCHLIGSCAYHTCPMGEGFDTFRFWESLALRTTPIVIDHPFYDQVQKQYPEVKMLRLANWSRLPSLLEVLQEEEHQSMPFLYEDYWISKIKSLKN